MTVPKWKRSASRLDAFYEAVKLRHIVTQMVMRTFKNMDALFDKLFVYDWHYQEPAKKERKVAHAHYGTKRSPAGRRHGLELLAEWD